METTDKSNLRAIRSNIATGLQNIKIPKIGPAKTENTISEADKDVSGPDIETNQTQKRHVRNDGYQFPRHSKPVRDEGVFSRSSMLVTKADGAADFKRSSSLVFDLSETWWKKIPSVLMFTLKIAFAPLSFIKWISDVLVSVVFLAIVGTAVLWYFNIIPDQQVVSYLNQIGERLLNIIRQSGAPL